MLSVPQMISAWRSLSSIVKNAGKRIVFNRDRCDRLRKKMPVRVRQQQDRFLRMIDDAVGEAGLVVRDQGNAILSGNIFARRRSRTHPTAMPATKSDLR